MTIMGFEEAIDRAVTQAMAADERIVVFGEDVPMIRGELLVRFGPKRVRGTPISESAFLGAAVGAAMAGLRPIAEVMMVDFMAVGLSALVNEASKLRTFSGGRWSAPMVVRAPCGGGYGDGGQHEQGLWGTLAGIPGLEVVVPSTPADAAGLMLAAIERDGPVVFLEHKLLSATWRESLGGGRRPGVAFDVPSAGERGVVPEPIEPVPIGAAAVRRRGADLTILSLGVGVHRALEAAARLGREGVETTVVDLRSVAPLDREVVRETVEATGRALVVDEDHVAFGLSGELAAVLAESGVRAPFARVGTEGVIPYGIRREAEALPHVDRILAAARGLVGGISEAAST